MTLVEQLNAAMRFAIYFATITLIIRRDNRILFFIVFVAFLTLIINKYHENTRNKRKDILERLMISEDRERGLCTKPTKNNPFMNVQFGDYSAFPSRPPACNISKRPIRNLASSYFDEGLYRDIGDVFQRNTSDRQFYTMPVTTIPNNQTDFAKWLYEPSKTCKENSNNCKVRF
jgi:hypothetical protein